MRNRPKSYPIICLVFLLSFQCVILLQSGKTEPNSEYKIKVVSHEKEEFVIEQEEASMDLMELLEIATVLGTPAMRFMSTKNSAEIIEVNAEKSSWKEIWVLYLDGRQISPNEYRRGTKVYPHSSILIQKENRKSSAIE